MRAHHSLKLSFVFVLLAALVMAACAPAPASPTQEATEEAADEPTDAADEPEVDEEEEAAEPEATEPASDEPVTLVYWSMWNEDAPQGLVVQQAIAAFEADHPNVTVDVTWNGRENRNLIVAALESGQAIDVFDSGADWMVANVAPTYATSLEQYLDQEAVGGDGATVRETIIPALLNQYPVDGEVVMLPFESFAVLFFYNKDHFADAGIDEAPETWDDFLAANQALVDAGHPPLTTDVDSYMDIIIGYYAQRVVGCETFQEAMADETGEMWRDAGFQQMAQDISDLKAQGYIAEGTEGNLYPAGQQTLALGEATMYLNGTWLPSEVQDTAGPDFNWGEFSFPTVANGVGSTNDVMLGSQAMIIPNTSENPDMAFEFMKYMVSHDAQTAMAQEAGTAPVLVGVDWPESIADAGEIVQNAESGIGWGCDIWGGGEVVANVVLPAFTDLFVGNLTPEEYIDRMVSESASFWAGQGQ